MGAITSVEKEFNKVFGTHKQDEKAPIFSNTGNYIQHEKNPNPKTNYKAEKYNLF